MFFKKKKQKQEAIFPFKFARVVWNKHAVSRGVFDDFNKEIQIVVNGVEQIERRKSYHKADVEALRRLGIPVVDLTLERKGKNFVFDIIDALSGTISEVVRI